MILTIIGVQNQLPKRLSVKILKVEIPYIYQMYNL